MKARLNQSLSCWSTAQFYPVLKQELQALPVSHFPLEQATCMGGFIDQQQLEVTILKSEAKEDVLCIRIGVFFIEYLSGCNCDDDPEPHNSYCEIQLHINRDTAEAEFSLL